MTHDQEEHLRRIQSDFNRELDLKYRLGQMEHGGNLWQQSAIELLDNAIKETLDMWTYLHALRDKLTAQGASGYHTEPSHTHLTS